MMPSHETQRNTQRQEINRFLRQAAATCGSTPALLMALLLSRVNDRGRCTVRQATLAKETALSIRAVRYAIQKLEAAGLLRSTPGSGRSTTRYEIQGWESGNGDQK